MRDVERAWEFDRAVQERAAREVKRFELGAALFNRELARVYDTNLVRIDRGVEELTVDELERIADSLQAGLAHRKLLLPGSAAVACVADEMLRRGWAVNRTAVMRYEGPRERDPEAAAAAEQVDPRAVRSARMEALAGRSHDVQRQVADFTERMAETTPARVFAAFADGEVASFCALLEGDGIGEIDEVTTLPRFRGRGLATAVVEAALQASLADGHDLTFLVANADDWPRGWYERLGFAEIGERFEIYRV
jgi:ribosomal protein S18 acetylase RimI-like enzyme